MFYTDREAQKIMARQRRGKLWRIAEAAEIRGATLYLAPDAASFTTGLMLVVDGGNTAK